jgi:hypothetical protein
MKQMKRRNRTLRLNYSLKVYKKDGTVQTYFRQLKSRLLSTIEANSMQKCYLKVEFFPNIYNHGEYTTKTELKRALDQFTEKDMIDYMESWYETAQTKHSRK